MHKKLLPVLLALVMILSVLPMAAFAEEAEHTHDENCGCMTTLAVCKHANLTYLSRTSSYSGITNDTHIATYVNRYICNDCGSYITSTPYQLTETHVYADGPQVDSGSFEGDSYIVVQRLCACGHFKYRTYWGYGSYSEYWFKP